MADASQVRASINRWLGEILPLDRDVMTDRIAYQASQEAISTEWRIYWDGEQASARDQANRRLVQIDRHRADGDEVALELELAQALKVLGLSGAGKVVSVSLYGYPQQPTTVIGTASVRRSRGDGWRLVPDVANRPDHLRATITLQVDYPA